MAILTNLQECVSEVKIYHLTHFKMELYNGIVEYIIKHFKC